MLGDQWIFGRPFWGVWIHIAKHIQVKIQGYYFEKVVVELEI